MSRNKLIAVGILIVLAVILGIAATAIDVTRSADANHKEPSSKKHAIPLDETEGSIKARHQFKDGVHTLVGEVLVPTPCHTLEAEVLIRESFPEQVTIVFSIVSTEAELCAQVVTPAVFAESFEASEEALITATLDGEAVFLDLIQTAEDLGELETSVAN